MMKQQLIKKKAVYENPKLVILSVDSVDVLTTSGEVENGVGVKWEWQELNSFWE